MEERIENMSNKIVEYVLTTLMPKNSETKWFTRCHNIMFMTFGEVIFGEYYIAYLDAMMKLIENHSLSFTEFYMKSW